MSMKDTGRTVRPPALQNIPIRTAHGSKIREAFQTKENALRDVDYADVEARIFASSGFGFHDNHE